MTAPVNRPSDNLQIANLMERVRILESVVPDVSTGGGSTACVNCFPVAPELAGCVSMKAGGKNIPETIIGFQPTPGSILTSKVEVGHYQCNYAAGFRVVVRYSGDYKRLELFGELWHNGVFFGRESIGTYGPLLGPVDTGSHQLHIDPTGVGDPTDNWQCYVGVENNSIIASGQIGVGSWGVSYEYGATAQVYFPAPRYEGEIMTSIGVPPLWQALEPGAPGTVLTINGAGKPEWV